MKRNAVVELLLACSADPNLADQIGMTPLLVAAISGELTIVKTLLRSPRVDRNHVDDSGLSAIEHAEE